MHSGNFNTTAQEIQLVEFWLQNYSPYSKEECEVSKYTGNRSDADILVVVKDQTTDLEKFSFTVEVKEEAYWRYNKYSELGIDYYSSFSFLHEAGDLNDPQSPISLFCKGIHRGRDWLESLNSYINVHKAGKVFYSHADVWLFVGHHDDNYFNSDYFAFWGKDIVNNNFRQFIENNCAFTINNKPEDQDSYTDTWSSMVYFAALQQMPPQIDWSCFEESN